MYKILAKDKFSLQVLFFSASATDSASGNIFSQIRWLNSSGDLFYTGAAFQQTFSAGHYSIRAEVIGSDQRKISVIRNFTVSNGSNILPVATDSQIAITRNSNFRQMNLTSLVSDSDGNIDWSSLEIEKLQFHGVSVVIDSMNASTINFDYSNGFSGLDSLRYRVKDNSGDWSNWAQITIGVCP